MNEFTKLELMHIGDALLYSIPLLESRKEDLISIRGKILEMNENYCEHENSFQLTSFKMYCEDCKSVF